MNIVSKNFSIYLNNGYNYKNILSSWNESFENVYSQVRKGNYLSKEFRLKYNEYPKYPLLFKYMKHSEKYDIIKIRESLFITEEDLINSIDENTIGLKVLLDKYPEYENDLVFDINLQRTFFTTANELYDKDLYFLDQLNTSNYQNLMYTLIGSTYEPTILRAKELQTARLPYVFTVLYFLCYIMPSICDIKYKLPYFIIENARFIPTKIHTEFDKFLNSYPIEQVQWRNEQDIYERTSYIYDNAENRLVTNRLQDVIIDLLKYDDLNGPEISEYVLGENIILNELLTETNDTILDVHNNMVIIVSNAQLNKEIITNEVTNIILRNVYTYIFPSEYVLSLVANELVGVIGRLPTYYEEFLNNRNSDPLLDISELLMSILFNTISIQQLKHFAHDYTSIPKNETDDILSLDRETAILSVFLDRINDLNIKKYILIAFLYKLFPVKFLSSFSILLKNYVETELMPINENYLTEEDTLSLLRELDTSSFFENLVETLDTKLNTENIFKTCTDYQISRFALSLYFLTSFDEFIESEFFHSFIEDILKFTANILYRKGYINNDFNWYECIDPLKLYFKSMLRHNLIKGELFKYFTIILNEDILYILQESNFDYDKNTLRTDFKNFITNKVNIKNIHNFIKNMYLGTVSKQVLYDVLKFFWI